VYAGPEEVTQTQEEHVVLPDGDDEMKDGAELAIQGGGMIAGGNSQSTAATGLARFLLRKGRSEGSFNAAVNYARAALKDSAGVRQDATTTTENYQGRIRYDYFWTKQFSSFLAVQARRDKFQGLDLRMGVDPGVTYYFLRMEDLKLWAEVAYDFQYDVLTQETVDLAASEGQPRNRTETDHNARVYLGYDQKLDERLSLLAGLEMFKSFVTGPAVRVNFLAELRTQLMNRFSLAVGSNTMFNNDPLPGVEKLDVTTSLSFVYTLL
jgi:putative salt-induced outer membrane protein YdiY